MTSILKVDQLQDSGGNAIITSDGAGNLTAGTIPAKTIGTGAVLQVITATDSTARTTTSTSFVTASNTMSVSITPSSTSNKIFVMATGALYLSGNGYAEATIYRDATNLGSSTGMSNSYDSSADQAVGLSLSYLDSPNTTSATTYQVYFRRPGASHTAYLNVNGVKGSITAFEIAG